MRLVALFSHWLGRQFLSLVLIILVLVIGGYMYSTVQSYAGLIVQRSNVKSAQVQGAGLNSALEKEARKRVEAISKQSLEALQRRTNEIDEEVRKLEVGRRSDIVRTAAFVTGDFMQDVEIELRIDILKQEADYLKQAMDALRTAEGLARGKDELERRRQWHKITYNNLLVNDAAIALLKESHPIASTIFGTQKYDDLTQLETDRQQLFKANLSAHDEYWKQRRYLESLARKPGLGPFEPVREGFSKISMELAGKSQQAEAALAKNWFALVADPALDVLPTALLVLLSAILTPIAIKAVFFYIIAPIAGHRPSIQLVPESRGELDGLQTDGAGGSSSTSLAVTLRDSEELLVHPEFVRSMAECSDKSTKWLLDNRYPMSSIAAGLYALSFGVSQLTLPRYSSNA